ncbi:MAG TPA: hypothetical protein DDY91_06950 [Planctomycetaceae bacterium]|nr:hypothetical protein [Planctomycetaceae bacterium]
MTQSGAIVAQELRVHALMAGADITLTNTANRVGTIAASTIDGDVAFRNSRNLQVASVQAGQGDVHLIVAGHVTQSGAIVGNHLRVETIAGSWFVDLQNTANLVQTLSVSTDNSNFDFSNNQSLTDIDIDVQSADAALRVNGSVQQVASGPVLARHLTIETTSKGGAITLMNPRNAVHAITFETRQGSVHFQNSVDLILDGLRTNLGGEGTDASVTVGGTLSQTAGVEVDRLTIRAGTAGSVPGDIWLDGPANRARAVDFQTLGGNVVFVNQRSLDDLACRTQGGNLTLIVNGGVHQAIPGLGPIEVDSLRIEAQAENGNNDDIDLRNTRNSAAQVDLNSRNGAVAWFSSDGFHVERVAAAGDIALLTDGDVTQQPGGSLTGNGLALRGTGTYTLHWTGATLRLAADLSSLTSQIDITTPAAVRIAEVDQVVGLRSQGAILRDSPDITQAENANLLVAALTVMATGPSVQNTLTNPGNQVDSLTLNTPEGTLRLVDTGDLTIAGVDARELWLSTERFVSQSASSPILIRGELEIAVTQPQSGIALRNHNNHAQEIDFRAGSEGVAWFSQQSYEISRLHSEGLISLATDARVQQFQPGVVRGTALALQGQGSFSLDVTAHEAFSLAASLNRQHSTLMIQSEQAIDLSPVDGLRGLRALNMTLQSASIHQRVMQVIETSVLALHITQSQGAIQLTGANNLVEYLTARTAGGEISFSNAVPLLLGQVLAGTAAQRGNITLEVQGDVRQQLAASGEPTLLGDTLSIFTESPGAEIALPIPANDLQRVRLVTQDGKILFRNSTGLVDLSAEAGIANIQVDAKGPIGQLSDGLGPIRGNRLTINSNTSSEVTTALSLNHAGNDVQAIAFTADFGNIEWIDRSGFDIHTLQTDKPVRLVAGAQAAPGGEVPRVTQSSPLQLLSLTLGGSADFDLSNPGNRVRVLSTALQSDSLRVHNLDFQTTGSLTIGSTTYGNGISLSNLLSLRVGGTLTVADEVNVGQLIRWELANPPSIETLLPNQDPQGRSPTIHVERAHVHVRGLRPYVTVTPETISPDVEVSPAGQVVLNVVIGRENETGLAGVVDWGDGTQTVLVEGLTTQSGIPENAVHFEPGHAVAIRHFYSPESIQMLLQDSAAGHTQGSNEIPIRIAARFVAEPLQVTRRAVDGEQLIANTLLPLDNSGLRTQFFTSVIDEASRLDLTQNLLTVLVSSPGITSPGLAVREFGSPGVIVLPVRPQLELIETATEPSVDHFSVEEVRIESDSRQFAFRQILVISRIMVEEQNGQDEFWYPASDLQRQLTGEVEPPDEIRMNRIPRKELLTLQPNEQRNFSELRRGFSRLPDGHYQILSLETDGVSILSRTVVLDVYLNNGLEIAPDLVEPPAWNDQSDPASPVPAAPAEPGLPQGAPAVRENASVSSHTAPDLRPWPGLWAAQSLAKARQSAIPSSPPPQVDASRAPLP